MHGEVTVHMAAPPSNVWELVSDVRNIGKFSPETFEAEWLDGATGPAVGARSAVTSGATRSGRCTGRRAA